MTSFSLGVQAGDSAANQAVTPHYMALRRLLEKHCREDYGPGIREYGPVLRIDGSISHWDKQGVDRFRITAKDAVASFDIYMPVEVWERTGHAIRQYLAKYYRAGIEEILQRAAKKKLVVHADKLRACLDNVIREFLAQ